MPSKFHNACLFEFLEGEQTKKRLVEKFGFPTGEGGD